MSNKNFVYLVAGIVGTLTMVLMGCQSSPEEIHQRRVERVDDTTFEMTKSTSGGDICILVYDGYDESWAVKLYDGACKDE